MSSSPTAPAFGGHALFVQRRRCCVYAYNFLGVPPRSQARGDPAPSSGHHIVGVEFTKESMDEHHVSHGTLKLYVDDEVDRRGR